MCVSASCHTASSDGGCVASYLWQPQRSFFQATSTTQARVHTHTHTLVVYNTVQYKQWVHTWSICQSNLQILQRKLQHRPGSDTNTPNTQQHTDRTHSATGARGSLQPGFNQVIPLHQRAHIHTHTHTHTHTHPHPHTRARARPGGTTPQVPSLRCHQLSSLRAACGVGGVHPQTTVLDADAVQCLVDVATFSNGNQPCTQLSRLDHEHTWQNFALLTYAWHTV